MTQNLTKKQLLDRLKEICLNTFGCTLEDATEKQMYRVVCLYTRVLMEEKRRAFRNEVREKEGKQVYYMSMEFLVGTSLRNNLYNLGLLRLTDEVLQEQGFSLERLCGMDPDAGLGNGGLGRGHDPHDRPHQQQQPGHQQHGQAHEQRGRVADGARGLLFPASAHRLPDADGVALTFTKGLRT